MKTIAEILTDYLNETKVDLIQSYREKGLKASGRAEDLEIEVKSNGFDVTGKITGPIQWEFMQNGRRPNKKKTKGQIYFLSKILDEWADQKGININTWLAARKIVYKVIQEPNRHDPGGVISDVINDKWEQELINRIGLARIEDFKTIIRTW